MKWDEVDINHCVQHIKDGRSNMFDFLEIVKDILNKYASGGELSTKQKNVIKRFYIMEVLKTDIFEDDNVANLTIEEIRQRNL